MIGKQKKATDKFTKESQDLLTNTDLGNLLHIVESFDTCENGKICPQTLIWRN